HRDVLQPDPPAWFRWRHVTGRVREALRATQRLSVYGNLVGPVALGLVEHVVSEIAPLGLHLALQLFPVAGDDVAIHTCSLWSGSGVVPACVHDARGGVRSRSSCC